MEIQDWVKDELGQDIWKKKYQQNNETFDEWLDRVSGKDKSVRALIEERKFLFGGRILASRGITDRKVTYSNCYVLPPVGDSIEDIYDTAKYLARTFSYGGGCGIDISQLRPKGSPVNNAAKTTSGAVSFMETFSSVSEVIGQEGRRGALMISMDCNHPDVGDFIDAKKNTDKLTGCNISVRVNDNFMSKIDVVGKESELFFKLAENNWHNAEPGILYWNTIEEYNMLNTYEDFKFAGVNPCITGDTLIQTTEGKIAIKDLVGTKPYVYCMSDDGKLIIRQASKVWKTRENAQLVEIDFNRGKLICTPDHKIYTRNRGWVEAKDLKPKDRLNGLGFSKGNEIDEMIKLTTDSKYYTHHRFIMEQMGHDIKGKDVHHLDENHLNNKYSNLNVLDHKEHSRLTNIGSECNCPKDKLTGKFICKCEHDKPKNNGHINDKVTGKNFIVKKVTVLDYTEDVYDMTVPEVHNFIANDIVIHNCAEEPLPAGGSCLLGAINLSEFVENPFTDKAAFNIPDFKATVRIAVKALNDVLDEGLDLHPLDIQKKCVSEWRQIGLGIMGFADALIKLGIRYGEQRSLELIDIIGKAMVQAGVHESIQIAKDTQPFEKFNCVNTINSSFIRAHIDVINTDDIMKYGMRNSQLFTIAPTGSISTMLGVSGGVEPIFQPTYTRTTKSLDENGDKTYTVVTPIIQQFLEANNLTQDDINNVNCITWAEKLNPLERVDVQAKWQEYIDASISSTVNLSNETTVSQVALLYKYAWERGCKGLTIYRAGCDREGILKSIEEKPKQSLVKNEEINKDELQRGEWAPIPEDTIYYKRKVYTGCGKINLFIGYSPSENKITDFYVKRSAEGGCEHNIDGQVICMSGMLRLGGSLANIEKAFRGLGACNSFARAKSKGKRVSKGKSCPTAILNEIKAFEHQMIYKKQPEVLEPLSIVIDEAQILSDTSKCPECGAELQMTGGCNVCSSCGYTKCD